ncbi:MAG: V-type ATP synthase subunit D [bacterium]|nr:V-type ATP synthase subunit D [bacterium]
MILKLPPTKSNMFKLEQDLRFAREGHDLLDRKREVLVMELMQIVHTIKNIQRRLAEQIEQAYATFRMAYTEMGSDAIERANYAYLEPLEIVVKERSVMGVPVPSVSAVRAPRSVQIGLMDTSLSFDAAIGEFAQAIPLLLQYCEANMTLTRLATELQKTQRRVNALENMFIPNTSDTIKYIRDVLEEGEREDFFRRKRVKKTI